MYLLDFFGRSVVESWLHKSDNHQIYCIILVSLGIKSDNHQTFVGPDIQLLKAYFISPDCITPFNLLGVNYVMCLNSNSFQILLSTALVIAGGCEIISLG